MKEIMVAAYIACGVAVTAGIYLLYELYQKFVLLNDTGLECLISVGVLVVFLITSLVLSGVASK